MATPLQQYSTVPPQESTPIDDYFIPTPDFIPNAATVDNRASYVAAITDDPIDTFNAVQGELNTTGTSLTAQDIIDKSAAEDELAVKDQLVDELVNSDESPRDKVLLVEEVNLNATSKNTRTLAAQSIYDNAQVTENNESERIFEQYGGGMQDYLDQKTKDWERNNLALASLGKSGLYGEFFQSTAPLVAAFGAVEIKQLKTLVQEAAGLEPTPMLNMLQSLVAQGWAKEDIVQIIAEQPILKQQEITEKLQQSIISDDAVIALDDNHINAIQNLHDLTTKGAYGNNEKVADTIFGILDLAGFGVLRGIRHLTRTAKFNLGRGSVRPVTGTHIPRTPSPTPPPAGAPQGRTFQGTSRTIPERPITPTPPPGAPTPPRQGIGAGSIEGEGTVVPAPRELARPLTIEEANKIGAEKTTLDAVRDLSEATQFRVSGADARKMRSEIKKVDAALDVLRAQRAGTKTTVDPDAARKVELQARIKESEADLAKVKADALQLDPDATKAVTDARIRELRLAGTFFDTTIKLAKKELGELGEFTSVKGTRPIGKKLTEVENSINALRAEAARLESVLKLNDQAKQAERDLAGIKSGKLPKWLQAEIDEATIVEGIDELADATNDAIRNGGNPASVSNIAAEFDPALARRLYSILTQVAQNKGAKSNPTFSRAVTGGPPNIAAITTVMPVSTSSSPAIRVSQANPDRLTWDSLDVPASVADASGRRSGLPYTQAEKDAARSLAMQDFQSVIGLTPVPNSFQIGVDGGGFFTIKGMYIANQTTGFANALQATRLAQFSLRKQGIKPEEIGLLSRNTDGTYSEVTSDPAILPDGEYVVTVDYKYDLGPHNVIKNDEANGELLASSWNVFDRFFNHLPINGPDKLLLNPSSMFSPQFVQSALETEAIASTMNALFTELIEPFNRAVLKLEKDSQRKLMEYFDEANLKQINILTDTSAQIRWGFDREEFRLVREWKRIWDGMFTLENQILVDTKIRKGYQLITTPNGDLWALGRPINRSQDAPEGVRYFDPVRNDMVTLDRDELIDLYNRGGSVSKLDYPMDLTTKAGTPGGEINHIILSNLSGEFYGRKLRPTDMILRYRFGFYHVSYTTPFVITRQSDGRAVAMVGSQRAAIIEVERLTTTHPEGIKYDISEERGQKAQLGTSDWEDIQVLNGRSPHRRRGQFLYGKVNGPPSVDYGGVLDPIQSVIDAAKSVSQAYAIRPWIDVMKRKYMDKYEDFLPVEQGQKVYGLNRDIIGQGKALTAATRMYEYINFMSFVASQGIDDHLASLVRSISNAVGDASIAAQKGNLITVSKGLEKLEKTLRRGAKIQPTALFRSAAFHVFIVHNPPAQWFYAFNQLASIAAIVPTAVPRMIRDWNALMFMLSASATNVPEAVAAFRAQALALNPDVVKLWDRWQESGLPGAVKNANLMEASHNQLSDFLAVKSPLISDILGAPKNLLYNPIEYFTLLTSWLAMMERAIKAGRNLDDPDVRRSISAQARQFALAQSQSTTPGYTKGAFGTALQFGASPHAAAVQMTTGKFLSGGERGSLASKNALLYGIPAAAIGMVAPLLEDMNEELGESIIFGFSALMLNKFLEIMFNEEDVETDPGTKGSPVGDIRELPILRFAWDLANGDLGEIVANAPGPNLFFGKNPILTDMAKDIVKAFYPDPDLRGDEIRIAITSFAGAFPGVSNTFKAKLAMDLGYSVSGTGLPQDPDINTPEAIFKMLTGGKTQTETLLRMTKSELFGDYDGGADAGYVLDIMARRINKAGLDKTQLDFWLKQGSMASRVFNTHPGAVARWRKGQRTRGASVTALLNTVIRSHGYKSSDEMRDVINLLPHTVITVENKNILRTMLDDIDAATELREARIRNK